MKEDRKQGFRRIYLYDTAAIIISGIKNRQFRTFHSDGLPTGGLYKLFNYINSDLKAIKYDIKTNTSPHKDTIVLCLESKNSIRKQLFPDYKENRGLDKDSLDSMLIKKQFEYFNRYIEKIGIPTLKIDQAEGDDVIYNLAYSNQDAEIIIRSDDKDLSSCSVVNPNVSRLSVSNKSNVVFTEPDHTLIDLILHGDSIDKIKSLRLDTNMQANLRANILNGMIPIYTDNINIELIREFCNYFGHPEYTEVIWKNIFLVQPKIVPPIETPEIKIDNNWLLKFLSIFRMKKLAERMLGEELDSSINIIEEQTELKYDLPLEIVEHFKKYAWEDKTPKYIPKPNWDTTLADKWEAQSRNGTT